MSKSRIPLMANQIAVFFTSQPEDERVAGVSEHINAFWEPRMRRQLLDLVAAGGEGLHPLVLAAAAHVHDPKVATQR